MTNPLQQAIRQGLATRAPEPTLPLAMAEEAMIQRAAKKTAQRKTRKVPGRKEGEQLVYHATRIFPEDAETLRAMAEATLRDQSFLTRLAVHLLCEAYRRNPKLRLAE